MLDRFDICPVIPRSMPIGGHHDVHVHDQKFALQDQVGQGHKSRQ